MKKIITALGNQKLNEILKEQKNFKIITNDIPYQEGILEILEKEKNIHFLILSELLPRRIIYSKFNKKNTRKKQTNRNYYHFRK